MNPSIAQFHNVFRSFFLFLSLATSFDDVENRKISVIFFGTKRLKCLHIGDLVHLNRLSSFRFILCVRFLKRFINSIGRLMKIKRFFTIDIDQLYSTEAWTIYLIWPYIWPKKKEKKSRSMRRNDIRSTLTPRNLDELSFIHGFSIDLLISNWCWGCVLYFLWVFFSLRSSQFLPLFKRCADNRNKKYVISSTFGHTKK